ncbi:MAG TPA: GTP-binding protein, partial [Methylomirabilota bacterium]|nr:GTP-binding protein [Methylomirabilota bacterium]
MALDIGKIRNVAFVGHGGVGKTSLVEALLHACGATTRLGKVDDGTTTTDFDPDEIKRKISLNTAAAFCDHKGHRLNLIDTPGYGDFVADARAGLRVAGAAIVVVDAVAGVQVQTEKVWKFANEYNLPRAIVINRLDRERADFHRTLEALQKRLKGRLVPLQLPIGSEAGFRGVMDLITMRALVHADGRTKDAEVPADLEESARAYREKLTEAAAETDDDLLAKYLEEGAIGEEEMLGALRRAIMSGGVVPVLCAAATRGIGVGSLLDLIVKEFPSPADQGDVEGADPRTKAAVKR